MKLSVGWETANPVNTTTRKPKSTKLMKKQGARDEVKCTADIRKVATA
jgi:hypothetical protein